MGVKRVLALVLAASAGAAAIGGCNVILGLEPAHLDALDGGSGQAATGATGTTVTSTATTSTGSGMSSASGTGGSTATAGTGAGSGGAMACASGSTMPCYTGPTGTEGVGICKGGTATCTMEGQWGACEGETVPQPRSCASTQDVACLGKDNCTQWAELFGNLAGASAEAIGVDANGNVFVAGTFSGSIALANKPPVVAKSSTDIFLLKLDSSGAPAWGKNFTGGYPYALAMSVNSAGDVALSGTCDVAYDFDGSSAGPGFWVTKVSGGGTVDWAKGLSTNCNTHCAVTASVALTSSGDAIVGGTVAKSSIDFGDGPISVPGEAGFVAKLRGSDGSGKLADGGWNTIICNATHVCEVQGVVVDSANNVLVAGTFSGTANFGSGAILMAGTTAFNVMLGKLLPGGSATWVRQIGDPNGANTVNLVSLGVDGAGGPILTGTFSGNVDFGSGNPTTGPTGTGPGETFLAHYGPDKAFLSVTPLPNATIPAVAGDAAGNVFFAGGFSGPVMLNGATLSVAGQADVLVAKLSNTGTVLWDRAYGTTGTQQATALAVTPQGAPVVAGITESPIDFGLGKLTPAASNGTADAFVVELSP